VKFFPCVAVSKIPAGPVRYRARQLLVAVGRCRILRERSRDFAGLSEEFPSYGENDGGGSVRGRDRSEQENSEFVSTRQGIMVKEERRKCMRADFQLVKLKNRKKK